MTLVFEGQGARSIKLDLAPGVAEILTDRSELRPLPRTGDVLADDTEPWHFQALHIAFQVAAARHLLAAGRRPTTVIGHSLGEISAAVVAGVLDVAEAIELARLRAWLPVQLLPDDDWAMAAMTGVDRDAVLSAVDGSEAFLVVMNSPVDLVVAGRAEPVHAAITRLGLSDRTCRILPMALPYHTPFMEPIAREIDGFLGSLTLREPAITWFSPTSGRTVRSAGEARGVLASMLVTPVDWAAALQYAVAAGATHFVDCGPSGALARFVHKNGLAVQWELAWEC